MNKDYLFKDFNRNSPTTLRDIRAVEELLEIQFPDDYIEFMLSSNGGEGQINERYLRLWEIEGIVEANGIDGYSILEFKPGLVVIGSDGGGTAIGYDFRSRHPKLVEVDFIGLDIDNPFYSTEDFIDYIEHLYNHRFNVDWSNSIHCRIDPITQGSNGCFNTIRNENKEPKNMQDFMHFLRILGFFRYKKDTAIYNTC